MTLVWAYLCRITQIGSTNFPKMTWLNYVGRCGYEILSLILT